MKKKIAGILAAAVIGTTAFATVVSAASGTINVISREDGSGTESTSLSCLVFRKKKTEKRLITLL